ncbi:potassium channel family protein [Rhizobium sp. XQZ8]|uniref:potassium channel family protein n=1 Tax=Rhizobium populisoli TaxID=2859785 RepID=UPI001C67CDA7|nr:potassium channel family protein [Rhizobium populisoli]MBW6424797.1 potassium channel family protein [Rhizobium populisoli]
MNVDEPRTRPLKIPAASVRQSLQRLESSRDTWALRWQAFFAFIDLLILAFFILGPYLRAGPSYIIIDYLIAAWMTVELVARAISAPSLKDWAKRPMTWIDIVILGTLLLPNHLFNFAFLRVMRIWAIGKSPLLYEGLRRAGFGHFQDVVRAVLNFLVFLFMVTGFVYTTFFYRQEGGEGFVDALYFTVATITTTGFGDITLPGPLGKLTSVVTMIVGISLFVRLAQAVVRPYKVSYSCHQCGLQRHDADAVHCKACGNLLNIPDEGI